MSEKIPEETFTTLRISKHTNEIKWFSADVSCKIRNILIQQDNLTIIHKWVWIFPDIKWEKLRLIFNDWEEVNLPEEMYKKLLMYIRNQWKIIDINRSLVDCNSFVSFVYWLWMWDRYKIFDETNETPFNQNRINPWDVIFLNNRLHNTQWNYHFALYLWKNLYISKFSNWNLTITTIEELKNFYNPTNVTILSKKDTKAS